MMRGGAVTSRTLLSAIQTGGRLEPQQSTGNLIKSAGQIPRFRAAAFELEADWKPHPSRGSDLSFREFESLSLIARASLVKATAADTTLGLDARRRKYCRDLENLLNVAHLNRPLAILDPVVIEKVLAQFDQAPTKSGKGLPPGRSLQIIGCRIGSLGRPLRLTNVDLPLALSFIGCVFEGGLILRDANLRSLDLSGSALSQLDASGLITQGSVSLVRSTVIAPTTLAGARIGGDLDLSDLLAAPVGSYSSEISAAPDRGMVDLSRIEVGNETTLDRARIWGGLSLRGAFFRRSVFVRGCTLASPLALLGQWQRDLDKPKPKACAAVSGRSRHAGKAGSGVSADQADEDPKTKRAEDVARVQHQGPKDVSLAGPNDDEKVKIEAIRKLEVLDGFTAWDAPPALMLTEHSERQISHAVRADQMIVTGSFFIEQTMVLGVFRARYARIKGSLRLGEAWLSAPFKIIPDLTNPTSEALKKIQKVCKKFPGAASESRALDLTRATVEGDISTKQGGHAPALPASCETVLSVGARSQESRGSEPAAAGVETNDKPENTASPNNPTFVCEGRIKLKGTMIGGSLDLNGIKSGWLPTNVRDSDKRYLVVGRPPETQDNQSPEMGDCQGHKDDSVKVLDGRRKALEVPFIDLDQARIGDDVDLRNAMDVWGVKFQNSRIGGSIYFSNKSSGRLAELPSEAAAVGCAAGTDEGPAWPRSEQSDDSVACPKHRKTSAPPLFRMTCEHRAFNLRGRVNLRGCEVAGDVHLLFDPDMGPELKLEQAQVAGRLDIYPQRRECTICETRRSTAELPAEAGCDLAGEIFVLEDPGGPKDLKSPYSNEHWHIDLRNARATVFSHAPGAWPRPGYLSLDGFRYEAVGAIGPLAPLPPLKVTRTSDEVDRSSEVFANYIVVFTLVFGLSLFVTAYLYLSFLTSFACFLLVAWIAVPWIASKRLPPKRGENQPLALSYLARQRTEPTRYQNISTHYVPLEPFDVATRAMRESGRYVSANLVEKDRLKRRVEMLSFRIHGSTRPLLGFAFLVSRFGFSTERMATLFVGMLVTLTLLLTLMGRCGWIEPADQSGTGATPYFCSARPVSFQYLDDFPGLELAVDLLTPLNLRQAELWTPNADKHPEIVRFFLIAARLAGVMFFLILGTALIARLESVFSKGRE